LASPNAVAASGTYYIEGTVAATGCNDIQPVTVIVNPNASIALTSAVGTDAQTLFLGSAITNITYSITGGGTGATVTGLPAGVTGSYLAGIFTISGTPTLSGPFNYTVNTTGTCVQTSANGTITVNGSGPLSGSISLQTDVLCFGANTGSVTVAGSGGLPPYQYKLNAGAYQASGTFGSLTSGVYTVTVIDALLNIFIVPVTINQPASALSVTTTQVNVLCFGASTGSATATPAGGTSPYTYSWNTLPVQTTATATGLVAGIYSITITDANSCTIVANITITQPAALLSVTTSKVDIACFGASTGSATATPAGGVGPYTYSWNTLPVQTASTATGLVAGAYTVTITDANSCTAIANVTVNQPAALLSVTTTKVDVACFGGATGSATAIPAGGTSPYTYSWNTLPVQTTATASGLLPGIYTVTVTDANSCITTTNVTIIQPAAVLNGSVVATNVLCSGSSTGTVTLTVTGGTSPYTYLWSNAAVTKNLTNVAAGTYTVTITDAGGCITTASATITQPATALTGTTIVTNELCSGGNNGAINLTVSGGTAPYTFLWSNSATTEDISSLTAGSYSVKVTDANGCFINSASQVTEPAKLTIEEAHTDATCPGDLDGSITLTITGGTQPYHIIWSDFLYLNSPTRTATDTTYGVVISDTNGCAASLHNIVVGFSNGSSCVMIPQVITPNGDGKNDTWIIKNIDIYPNAEVLIYNRWGELIFQTKNIMANPWDGRSRGKLVPVDSYHYILDLHDGSKPKSGVISVIR